MTTADKLREISMTLQIHKKLDQAELLAVMGSLIDIAERLERVESVCPGHKKIVPLPASLLGSSS